MTPFERPDKPFPSQVSQPTSIFTPAWGVEHGEYSPDRFYVTSGEGGGQLRVKISDSTLGEMAALVQSAKIPEYRTMQDIVRDSLFHRLHYTRERIESGTLDKTLTGYADQSRLDTLKRRNMDERRYIDTARDGIEEAAKVQDRAAMGEWVEAIEEKLVRDKELSPVAREELRRLLASYGNVQDS